MRGQIPEWGPAGVQDVRLTTYGRGDWRYSGTRRGAAARDSGAGQRPGPAARASGTGHGAREPAHPCVRYAPNSGYHPVMDRIAAWYRVSSSVGAVVALVAANLVPLIGVLFLGWNVWNVLVVYWLENGIVGVFNVLKMARAEGPVDGVESGAGSGATLNGRPLTGTGKGALIPFFIVHYGLFWFVHGIFVLTLPLFTGLFGGGLGGSLSGPYDDGFGDPFPGLVPGAEPSSTGFDPGTILFAVIALALSHGASYWWNFRRGGEYRRVTAAGQMFAPYGRLFVLHLTIIFGAMAIIATGAPVAAVAVLVAIKTVLDIGFHLAEHRRVATPG